MSCCGQNNTGAGAVAIDTGKRVNYTKGMLLGVDDFVQEQAWHIARRHELAREVLGYGTVRGLKVGIDPGTARVRVTPGVALMPSGKPVCVPSEQCCDINRWLGSHWGDADVRKQVEVATQPAPVTLYVVLAYDTCLTDRVPVPGEPCRSEEDLTVESRIADCFTLELRTAPPAQVEEDAVRDFADWIAAVPTDTTSPPMTEIDFLAQLRAAAHDWLEPVSPHPTDYMFGAPPASLASTDALLRTALRLWVTELRPLWRAKYGCGPNPTVPGGTDDAVLLAALDLRVSATTREAEPDGRIVEDARPVLLSLRMVQELIAQNPAPEPAASVVAETAFGLAASAGTAVAYARDDHSHGTPALAGDVAAVMKNGQEEVRVIRLQDVAVSSTAPLAGQMLAYDGTVWKPTPVPASGPTGNFVERDAGVFRIAAAGQAQIAMEGLEGQVTMRASYARLDGTVLPGKVPNEVVIRFVAVVRRAFTEKFDGEETEENRIPTLPFIVKLTPVWIDGQDPPIEFSPYLLGIVHARIVNDKPNLDAIEFDVRLRLSQPLVDPEEKKISHRFGLHIEVSRFEFKV